MVSAVGFLQKFYIQIKEVHLSSQFTEFFMSQCIYFSCICRDDYGILHLFLSILIMWLKYIDCFLNANLPLHSQTRVYIVWMYIILFIFLCVCVLIFYLVFLHSFVLFLPFLQCCYKLLITKFCYLLKQKWFPFFLFSGRVCGRLVSQKPSWPEGI